MEINLVSNNFLVGFGLIFLSFCFLYWLYCAWAYEREEYGKIKTFNGYLIYFIPFFGFYLSSVLENLGKLMQRNQEIDIKEKVVKETEEKFSKKLEDFKNELYDNFKSFQKEIKIESEKIKTFDSKLDETLNKVNNNLKKIISFKIKNDFTQELSNQFVEENSVLTEIFETFISKKTKKEKIEILKYEIQRISQMSIIRNMKIDNSNDEYLLDKLVFFKAKLKKLEDEKDETQTP